MFYIYIKMYRDTVRGFLFTHHFLNVLEVNQAGCTEIEGCLNPQPDEDIGYIVNAATHSHYPYIAVHTQCRRENVGEVAPELGHCRPWS